MKTIGLSGGMSWESTVTYYKIIKEITKDKLGGLHSAKYLLCSIDFQETPVFDTTQIHAEKAALYSIGQQL